MSSVRLFWLLSTYFIVQTAMGYGEKVDTIPMWQERAVLVLTNACRLAPVVYRDRFIKNETILLPKNYPPVPPLYWNRNLNAAARFHCVEMGFVCGMSHDCNGITFEERVRGFYSSSSYIGENIAQGYQNPQDVVNGWLIDGRSAAEAAPDGNGDGHRKNIMSSRFGEIGCGYFQTGTGRDATNYWCQDFGGGKSEFSYHPVPAASHLFFSKDSITFFANLYDTIQQITRITLYLEKTYYQLECVLGTNYAGTYSVSLPVASSCRSYRFKLMKTDGSTIYYPEKGMFLTTGEGQCTDDYTTYLKRKMSIHHRKERFISVMYNGSQYVCKVEKKIQIPIKTQIVDCRGRMMYHAKWDQKTMTIPVHKTHDGFMIFIHLLTDGSIISDHFINSR